MHPAVWTVAEAKAKFSEVINRSAARGRARAIDGQTGDLWARIVARGQKSGRPPAMMDAFIAATAQQHDLALVTRHVAQFVTSGLRLVSRWKHG